MYPTRSLISALLLSTLSHAAAFDWPQWRGPNRDGISSEKDWNFNWPTAGPKQLWKANVGVGYSTVSVSKGRLFTMGNTADVDAVWCLDAETGKQVWKHTYSCPATDPNGYHGTRSTPTIDDDRVYSLSRQGQLFCLNVADGKVIWSKDFKTDYGAKVPTWGYAESPLIEADRLIVTPGAPGASVVALDKMTGDVVWKNGDDPAAYSSLIAFNAGGERCLACFSLAGLVGRSAKDGKELWRHEWKTSWDVNAATPIISGDKIFISSGYNRGCALLQLTSNSVKVLWENRNMRNHHGTCVLWRDHLYGFDESELRCLVWNTGQVKWKEGRYGKGTLLLAGDKFIIYSDKGRVAVAELSPAGLKELCGAQVLGGKDTWAMPVLSNGRLYCRSLENLVCLNVKRE
jgi:outer membrane protein assembly factor BamB